MNDLTEAQRAKLGVAAGMLSQFDGGENATGAPSAFDEFSAPIDNAISTTAHVGAPEFAQTREQRAARVRAIQESGGQTPAAAKPKPTRAQVLDRLEVK